jgi:predicted transcriptional regulator
MNRDDILHVRIRKELGKKDIKIPRDYTTTRKRLEIMNVILSHDKEGIHHNRLAKIIGMDRKNLRPHITRLVSKGLIIRESGKHGKYFPATKSHRGTIMNADILVESFKERFLQYDEDLFVLESPYFKRDNYDEFELEDALFNFSNIIGGFITYILIQSMNPANKITDHTKDNIEKNLLAESWVEDIISLIQPYLLFFLKNSVCGSLETLNERIRRLEGGFNVGENIDKVIFGDFLLKHSYMLDKGIIFELTKAFSNIYPNLNHELEKIRSELPLLVQKEMDEMDYIAERWENAEKCIHRYEPPEDNSLQYGYGDTLLHCKKCHSTKIIPKKDYDD